MGFDTGIGAASAAGSVAACTLVSIGIYVLVLVVVLEATVRASVFNVWCYCKIINARIG